MIVGRAPSLTVSVTLLGLLSCAPAELPPAGQIVLYFDTDATLPAAPGEAVTAADAPPLFDRLRVDLALGEGGEPCLDCTRDFALDRQLVSRGEASIGLIVPAPGARARVRLFLAAARTGDEPPPDSTIDVTVALPLTGEEGRIELTVMLPVETVGTRLGYPTPIEASPGRPSPSQVGTWPGAQRLACAEPPREGEACIPGGAYWMGNPRAGASASAGGESDRQRLVIVSPFFLGDHEVTVAEFRSVMGTLGGGGVPWSGEVGGEDAADYCNFTPEAGPRDDLPMNCLPVELSRAHCQALGGDLPSEAQLEYAAGGLESRLYPWGSDDPGCADAVFARGGHGAILESLPSECRPPGSAGGPLAAGPIGRHLDRISIYGAVVYDLAGNVAEFCRDAWNRQDEPCWAGAGVRTDPVCDQIGVDGDARRVLGGSWVSDAFRMRAAARHWTPVAKSASFAHGFRCARPATP